VGDEFIETLQEESLPWAWFQKSCLCCALRQGVTNNSILLTIILGCVHTFDSYCLFLHELCRVSFIFLVVVFWLCKVLVFKVFLKG
jgi:hypothetical protein